jgi:hypothetical protein
MDGGVTDGAVTVEAAVFSGETAWLVAHLADEPDPSHGGDSDSVRRLSQMGAEGVLAVAEVFRVGDVRRIPYARRVIERVALRRCLRDHGRAGWRVTALERGTTTHAIDPDAGVVWTSGDARWSNEAVERVRQWARDGMPCGDPSLGGRGRDVALTQLQRTTGPDATCDFEHLRADRESVVVLALAPRSLIASRAAVSAPRETARMRSVRGSTPLDA